jgi:hypothetical protein
MPAKSPYTGPGISTADQVKLFQVTSFGFWTLRIKYIRRLLRSSLMDTSTPIGCSSFFRKSQAWDEAQWRNTTHAGSRAGETVLGGSNPRTSLAAGGAVNGRPKGEVALEMLGSPRRLKISILSYTLFRAAASEDSDRILFTKALGQFSSMVANRTAVPWSSYAE